MSRLLGMATWLSASPFVLCFVWFSGFGSGSLTPALTATLDRTRCYSYAFIIDETWHSGTRLVENHAQIHVGTQGIDTPTWVKIYIPPQQNSAPATVKNHTWI